MLTLSILVWEFSKRLQLIQARKQTPNCNVKIPQTEAKGIILGQTGYKVNYAQNRQRITKCWFIITTPNECFKQKLTNFLKLLIYDIKKLKKKVNQQTFTL